MAHHQALPAPPDNLTAIRHQLDNVIAEIAADHESLQQREAAVAAATEQLSQDASVQAAWQHGCTHERSRLVTLIDLQLDTLQRGGTNATVLYALRRMVLEVEG
jgi:hypothetical protein